MRTLVIVSVFMLVGCGKAAPDCPARPVYALDCTPDYQYGTMCESQPWYTANGLDSEVAKYNATCSNLLGK